MLHLELIELADLVRPEQLVAEIVRQNPELPVPVPLEELANLVGINKIEAFDSEGFEGALVANATKSAGAIFYSARGTRERQRFTVGHELGHFLLPWHRQSTFQCTAEDTSSQANKDWEVQANQFSAELLMPEPLVKARLQALRDPEISHILALRNEFETSTEMTARRTVELSDYACAVVFSKDNVVRYTVRSPLFEHWLAVRKGGRLPTRCAAREGSRDPNEWAETEAHWWLAEGRQDGEQPESVYEQTLVQAGGHKLTLLTYD